MSTKKEILYTAVIKMDKGARPDFSFSENETLKIHSLVKTNLVGRIMFLVEGINLLAEKGELDSVEKIEIEIMSDAKGLTVMRNGNGIPEGEEESEAAKKMLFLLEVLDRRLANFCELFAKYI